MANTPKTVIVTGGSQGIGSGAVKAFLDRDYNVVATSRNVTSRKNCRRRRSWPWWMAILGKPLLPQEWRKQPSAHSARLMH
jgi:NAD(P)-dependent dehydrogenase (short-subunit alcohol dehydrogenase family)